MRDKGLSVRHLQNEQLTRVCRSLYASLFEEDRSINQHSIVHTIQMSRQFAAPCNWDAQIGEGQMGLSSKYAEHTSRYSYSFAFKRLTQLFCLSVW
jgi:hypothetical protein